MTEPAHITRPTPRIIDIQAAVCRQFGLTLAELQGPCRNHAIAHPRQLAMTLACRLTKFSMPAIGRRFGDRDHATVSYARSVVRLRIARDPELAEIVERLEAKLLADAVRPPCTCPDCRAGDHRFPLDPPQLHLPIALPGELPLEARAA